jgi:hypothetical protein
MSFLYRSTKLQGFFYSKTQQTKTTSQHSDMGTNVASTFKGEWSPRSTEMNKLKKKQNRVPKFSNHHPPKVHAVITPHCHYLKVCIYNKIISPLRVSCILSTFFIYSFTYFGFWDRMSLCSPGGIGFTILLLQPPECWDYRHLPPHPVLVPFQKPGVLNTW